MGTQVRLWMNVHDSEGRDVSKFSSAVTITEETISFIISFDANGGSGYMTSIRSGEGTLTLPSNSYYREDYSFVGWNTKQDGTGHFYVDQDSITIISNTTLYAQWEKIRFSILFSPNGGTGAPAVQTKQYGVTLTLSDAVPTRPGYTFLGWAESADAETAAYLPGGSFTKDEDTKLYAVWKQPDFILPAALTAIESEAFSGGAFTYVKIPDTTISIGRRAFANCPNLAYIYIPQQTTQIDPQAFGNKQDLTIIGQAGSTAETYAQDHKFTFIAVP